MTHQEHLPDCRQTSKRRANFAQRPADIFVCAYSSDHSRQNDHFDIISRSLLGIVKNTNPNLFRLHIGCNNLSPRTMALVDWLVERFEATKHVGDPFTDIHGRKIFPKYPLMRKMYSATHAEWIVWFDDDCYVSAPDWLEMLEKKINTTPGADQFGDLAMIVIATSFKSSWIEPALWYNPQKVLMRDFPEGRRIVSPFVRGGFYAISRNALDACGIPDPRLIHNDGDWTTGMALLHQGYGLAHHLDGVTIGDEPRRGIHEDEQCDYGVANQKDLSVSNSPQEGTGASFSCS